MLKGIGKIAIYPLMGILYLSNGVFQALSASPELAAVAAGLAASALIGLVYLAPVTFLVSRRLRRYRLSEHVRAEYLLPIWVLSLVLVAASEMFGLRSMMAFATATMVLSTLKISMLWGAAKYPIILARIDVARYMIMKRLQTRMSVRG